MVKIQTEYVHRRGWIAAQLTTLATLEKNGVIAGTTDTLARQRQTQAPRMHHAQKH
jgi:hypothetical protein